MNLDKSLPDLGRHTAIGRKEVAAPEGSFLGHVTDACQEFSILPTTVTVL